MTHCKPLIIFEGPDGAGKTTMAQQVAKRLGYRYVHFSALPEVGTGLARMYVEAMLPALLGYQGVVFDRCWLSEVPYGDVFRRGENRLGNAFCRMLERVAMRCDARVVHACPPLDACLASYRARKGVELLENEAQLTAVYQRYLLLSDATDLRCVPYDYTRKEHDLNYVINALDLDLETCHPLALRTAGNWLTGTLLVGEGFGERKNQDPFYQWPFGSFSRTGCSEWLALSLELAGINEDQLLWVNADEATELLDLLPLDSLSHVVALGKKAATLIENPLFDHLGRHVTEHPQYWKRFRGKDSYPLVTILKELSK